MMINFESILTKLTENLNHLEIQIAKYGGSSFSPISLINQIADYKEAIKLTQAAKSGEISVDDWHKQLQDMIIDLETINKSFKVEPQNSSTLFGKPDKKYTYDLFVLMPFAQNLKPIYDDHIKKIAGKLNLTIARADDFFSQNSIMQEVWSAIALASILIADCTGKNPNVFYEIGLAHALEKPVILITQNPDDVPFDLRHRRYILYAYSPPGMKIFENALSKTILTIKEGFSKT